MNKLFFVAALVGLLSGCMGFHLDVGGYIGAPPAASVGYPGAAMQYGGGPVTGQCLPAGCRPGDAEVKRWTDAHGCLHTQCVAR